MHLSTTELARLELMFTAGQVRSDPPTLCPTIRMMDAMIAAARMKVARTQRPPRAATSHPAVRERPAPVAAAAEVDAQSGWGPPRTLDELIEIRRALLRNEQPEL